MADPKKYLEHTAEHNKQSHALNLHGTPVKTFAEYAVTEQAATLDAPANIPVPGKEPVKRQQKK